MDEHHQTPSLHCPPAAALLGTPLPWNSPRASCAAREVAEKTPGLESGWTKKVQFT